MSFGSRLRERRESLHMKQSELGRLLGVTGSAIGNYENGISSPKADVLYRVFDVLGCDANYLFQDEMENAAASLHSADEVALMKMYRQLNDEGQEKMQEYADDLVSSGKYEKADPHQLGKMA